MNDDVLSRHRPPAEPVSRITRLGADQYVLACNARREAGDVTFADIVELERANSELRRELAWKRDHGSTFTGRWIRTRLLNLLTVLAILAMFASWLRTADGKSFRVASLVGSADGQCTTSPCSSTIRGNVLTSDMTQHEVDSIVATIRTMRAGRH
ncbi:hypothetical protein BH11GEM1_BH11GEM1_20470 [soil metagenome]